MTRSTRLLLALSAAAGSLAPSAPAAAQTRAPRLLSFVESVRGSEDVSLRWPVGVAAASDEEIVVADAHEPRLLRFGRIGVSWQLDRAVPLGGTPVDLVWDGRRYLASLRNGQGLVGFEGKDLAPRKRPLPRGVVPGSLAALPGGALLVYDEAGARVVRVSGEGALLAEVPVAGQVSALAASATGGFFAAVAVDGAVLRFDASGALDATWSLPPSEGVPAWPSGLAVDPGGDLLVVDRHAGQLLVLDASGQVKGVGARKGWEPGLLLFPAGLARLPGGLVLVADEGNGRAQIFRRTDSGAAP